MAMKQVENDLRMASGAGENSYAANSRTPQKAILENMPLFQKAVEEAYLLSLSHARVMVVADLGCSSGMNTLLVVAEVIGTIREKCQKIDGHHAVEVQFFLNDLPSNDFNLIFQSLDQLQNLIGKEESNDTVTPPYYVTGLPGSFYKRLFPCQSVHLFHSSYCLHWLSRVPNELLIGNYLNGGNIHIGKTTPQNVIEQFREQFKIDFESFLTLRSKELVAGGRMLLMFLGRKSEQMLMHGEIGMMWELFAESLRTLVLQGLVTSEKLDTFNLPLYALSMDEVKILIDRTKLFHIEHMGMVEFNWDPQDDSDNNVVLDPSSSETNVAKSIRAVLGPLIEGHFGEDIIEELFMVYASVVAKHLEEAGNAKCPSIVVSLKKKEVV